MNKNTHTASKSASKSSARVGGGSRSTETKSKANPIFLANLPCFKATIRGNVVADSETFTAKSGTVFETYRLAYNRKKDNRDSTMFIKVFCEEGQPISKGSYVEVSGDYHDEMGEYQGNASIYRTMFAETVKVLIEKGE